MIYYDILYIYNNDIEYDIFEYLIRIFDIEIYVYNFKIV